MDWFIWSATYITMRQWLGIQGYCTFMLKKYGITVLNGRPRHLQTQALVEKHNSTLKRKLQAWIEDSGGCRHWAQALPEIALSMNHQTHSTTGESPYRVVFKQ